MARKQPNRFEPKITEILTVDKLTTFHGYRVKVKVTGAIKACPVPAQD